MMKRIKVEGLVGTDTCASRTRLKVFLALCAVAVALAAGEIPEIGTLTRETALGWDGPAEAVGYKIFVADAGGTNFVREAVVSTNRWAGDESKRLDGWRAVYVTAVNAVGVESDPCVTNLVRFRAGAPESPRNFQIYTFLKLAATNAVEQAVPVPSLPGGGQ